MRDAYKVGATAGILVNQLVEELAQREPLAPFVGGFTTPERQLGIVMMGSSDEALAWLATGPTNAVVVGHHAEDREISVVVPHSMQASNYALLYMLQYTRGGGRVFTSQPDRRVREPDLDLIRDFNRGFDEATAGLDGWGELGNYERAEG